MNPLTYETKRAHWNATWYGIRLFRKRAVLLDEPMLLDMTPARFDVLYATWMQHAFEHERAQELGFHHERQIPMADLRRNLGLAGSTISRLAHALEVLKFVRVVRDPVDRRRVSVVLTDRGIQALQLGIECITAELGGVRGHIERFVHRHASDGLSQEGRPIDVRHRVLDRLCTIIDRQRAFAYYLGSRALPIYDPRVVSDIPLPTALEEDH